MSLKDSNKCIFSQASEDGPLLFGLQDGPKIEKSGQAHARVSPTRQRGKGKAMPTSETCGPQCSSSFNSDDLSVLLASRLQQLLGTVGSMEYSQTWKEKVTPAGRLYWAHTASVRRTSDSDCGGWPAPNAGPQNDNDTTWQQRQIKLKAKHGNGNGFGMTLGQAAQIVKWASPSARDWKDTPGMATTGTNPDGSERTRIDQLPRQPAIAGTPSPSSPVATERRGVLNPALARWLMGYPPAWDDCGVMAMPSSRKRQQRSSQQ